jgi:hypothetical protein
MFLLQYHANHPRFKRLVQQLSERHRRRHIQYRWIFRLILRQMFTPGQPTF